MFLSDVQWCFVVACPFKCTKIKRPNSHDNGWVTNEIIQEGQILKSTFNNLKSNQNVDVSLMYRNMKRQHKLNFINAKRTYYNNKLRTAENRSKEIGNMVNQRLGKTNFKKPYKIKN